MYNAVRQGRPPNLIGLHAELESGWHALCVRAGLAQPEGEAPPLQTERLLGAPSRNMNDLVITLGLPFMHTTLQPWANRRRQFAPQLEPQMERQQGPSSEAATASPSSHGVSISSTFSGSIPPSSFGNTTPLYPERPRPPQKPSSLRLPDPEMPYHVATMFVLPCLLLKHRIWLIVVVLCQFSAPIEPSGFESGNVTLQWIRIR